MTKNNTIPCPFPLIKEDLFLVLRKKLSYASFTDRELQSSYVLFSQEEASMDMFNGGTTIDYVHFLALQKEDMPYFIFYHGSYKEDNKISTQIKDGSSAQIINFLELALPNIKQQPILTAMTIYMNWCWTQNLQNELENDKIADKKKNKI